MDSDIKKGIEKILDGHEDDIITLAQFLGDMRDDIKLFEKFCKASKLLPKKMHYTDWQTLWETRWQDRQDQPLTQEEIDDGFPEEIYDNPDPNMS